MSTALRNLSARPELVVSDHGRAIAEQTVPAISPDSRVGLPGPFGRERVVEALPLNKAGGAVQLAAAVAVHDAALGYLADPDGNLIGTPAVWVHRMAYARWTLDTRRLAG